MQGTGASSMVLLHQDFVNLEKFPTVHIKGLSAFARVRQCLCPTQACDGRAPCCALVACRQNSVDEPQWPADSYMKIVTKCC